MKSIQTNTKQRAVISSYKWHLSQLLFTIIIICCGCGEAEPGEQQLKNEITASEAAIPEQPIKVESSVAIGTWIRTDADYRIEIAELYKNGKIKAGYFNPASINVGDTRWTNEAGMLKMSIELRDVNYPGSKYNLTYRQSDDVFAGAYYQAVERTTYKVQFKRQQK